MNRPRWAPLALTAAAGFLVGVVLVVALGGGVHDDTRTITHTTARTITKTVPASITTGGTVVVTVPMPDVVGQPYDVALDRIHAEGLHVEETDDSAFGVLINSDFTVVAQDPKPGKQVQQGSTVHLDLEQS